MAMISCVIQYILVHICFICSSLYVSCFNAHLHRLDDTDVIFPLLFTYHCYSHFVVLL